MEMITVSVAELQANIETVMWASMGAGAILTVCVLYLAANVLQLVRDLRRGRHRV